MTNTTLPPNQAVYQRSNQSPLRCEFHPILGNYTTSKCPGLQNYLAQNRAVASGLASWGHSYGFPRHGTTSGTWTARSSGYYTRKTRGRGKSRSRGRKRGRRCGRMDWNTQTAAAIDIYKTTAMDSNVDTQPDLKAMKGKATKQCDRRQ